MCKYEDFFNRHTRTHGGDTYTDGIIWQICLIWLVENIMRHDLPAVNSYESGAHTFIHTCTYTQSDESTWTDNTKKEIKKILQHTFHNSFSYLQSLE